MPLNTQLLSLPIVGGLNEKEDKLISTRPQQMTNCIYRKTGSVSKRYGYDCIGPYNRRLDGSTPPVGETLTTLNGELLRIGGGCIDSYDVVNGTSEWIARGKIPECIVSVSGRDSVGNSIHNNAQPNSAYASGYIVTSYIIYDGTNYIVLADVVNTSTGAKVYSQYNVTSSPSALVKTIVLASGTTAFIFWSDASRSEIWGDFIDLTTMVWNGAARVAANVSSSGLTSFDCDVVSATEWVCVFEAAGQTHPITIQAINGIQSGSSFVITHGPLQLSTTDSSIKSMSLRCLPGNVFWVTYGVSISSVLFIKGATVTTSYAAGLAPFVIYTDGSNPNLYYMAIEADTTTSIIVAWNTDEPFIRYMQVTNGPTLGQIRILKYAYLLSRPLVRNMGTSYESVYALVMNVHSTHGTQFLVDLGYSNGSYALPSNGSPRIVATILPRQLYPANSSHPRIYGAANWSLTATNEFFISSMVLTNNPSSSNSFPYAIVGLNFSFDSAWIRTTAESQNVLFIGGGTLSAYDGNSVFEIGFAHEPDTLALTASSGGSLTPSSTYGYQAIYTWEDSQGNTYRSIPSSVASVSMGSNTKVTVTVPTLHLTNKMSADPGFNVLVELYRTQANGSVLLFLNSAPNDTTVSTVSFVDTASDVSIASNETIYTTGGVLDRVIPSGGSLLLAWSGALLLAGTEDDTTWISGEILQGDGAWFNDSLTIAPFDGGDVTALSIIDNTPVIAKSAGLWYLQGNPPDDLGNSTIGAPIRIQTEAGCIDPNSVISTSLGMLRMSQTGLYQLDRSLQDTPIGKGIENSYRVGGFAGVEVLPSQNIIRWLQKGTSGFDALNLDYYHMGIYGSPVWSKDVLSDVKAGSSNASPVGATLWNGTFVWLSAAGYLYRENSTRFADWDGGSTFRWVSMTFETGFEKSAGISAFQRARRIYVTGARTSPHDFEVVLTTDLGVEGRTWPQATIDALLGFPIEKVCVHASQQKCQWMQVMVQDETPSSFSGDYGDYSGLTIQDVTIEMGIKGRAQLPTSNKK